MGIMVSIWSIAKKQGKTTFAYALGSLLPTMCKKDAKILLVCVNAKYGSLLKLFDVEHDISIEELINMATYNKSNLDPTKLIRKKGSLYLLGSKNMSSEFAARNIEGCKALLTQLKNTFDLVIVDTVAGHDNLLTSLVLQESDHVINVITQDKQILDISNFKTPKDVAYIINRYRNIYPSEKEMDKLYDLGKKFTLPESDELHEMRNRDKLGDYLLLPSDYTKAVKQIADFLLATCQIHTHHSSLRTKRKGFAGLFRRSPS